MLVLILLEFIIKSTAPFYKSIFFKGKSAEKLGSQKIGKVFIWGAKVSNFPLSYMWKKNGLKLPILIIFIIIKYNKSKFFKYQNKNIRIYLKMKIYFITS